MSVGAVDAISGGALDPAFDPSEAPQPITAVPAYAPNPADVAPAIGAVPPIVRTTELAPPEEQKYQAWKKTLPARLQSEDDYDLRGFYQQNPNFSVNTPGQHMTDEFKLPNHPTFSDESKYYNDQTAPFGGHWEGDVFVPNDINKKARVDETAQPGGAPVVPPPGTPVEGAKRNAEAVTKLGEEATANAQEKADLDKQQADLLATFKAEHGKALTALLDRQAIHRQAAETAIADQRAKAESEPYHTFWEGRSIGENILTGIGLILGGVSWNPEHVNRGVQILENAMNRDAEQQKAKHADLWRAVDEAEKGIKDLDGDQLRDLSAFNAAQGAKWDAVAGRLGAMIAANKGKGDVTTAKKVVLEASEKANTAWQNAETAAATANFHEQEAKNAKERADAAMLAAQNRGKKKGGGGGGPGRADALSAFSDAAAAIPVGKPIPPEVIKLGLRAGIKADKIPDQVAKYREAGAKDQRVEGLNVTTGEKDANLILYDPQTGKAYGKAHNARETTALSKQDVQYGDAARRIKELGDDIRENGAVVASPEAVQRRAARFANAIIGVAIVSPLGKTDSAMHEEAATLGIPGTIDTSSVGALTASIAKSLVGYRANISTVERKAEEVKRLRQEFRNTIPISAEERARYDKLKATGAGGESHPDRVLKNGHTAKWNAARGGYEEQNG